MDALIAIGGEDTLGVAKRLHDDGVQVVGVPKTIDNDLAATDYTFGFDTAVNIAMEAIDRLHTTAESHHRALVVEVMGRHAGWIALHAGMAGGANVILMPEQPFDLDAVCDWVERRFRDPLLADHRGRRGRDAEGGHDGAATGELDAFGHVRLGGVGQLAGRRGGEADRQGVPRGRARARAARRHADRVRPGAGHPVRARARSTRSRTGRLGQMVALRGTDIVRVPLAEATAELKTVPVERYAEAEVFFG